MAVGSTTQLSRPWSSASSVAVLRRGHVMVTSKTAGLACAPFAVTVLPFCLLTRKVLNPSEVAASLEGAMNSNMYNSYMPLVPLPSHGIGRIIKRSRCEECMYSHTPSVGKCNCNTQKAQCCLWDSANAHHIFPSQGSAPEHLLHKENSW